MFCPLENREIGRAKCPATCLYNNQGKCKYSVMNGVETKEERIDVLRLQGHEEEEVKRRANKIKAFLYTNVYCQYLIGRGLLEITDEQIRVVLASQEQHDNWANARELGFKAVTKVLNHILENRS